MDIIKNRLHNLQKCKEEIKMIEQIGKNPLIVFS
jgi:hypothetical protein